MYLDRLVWLCLVDWRILSVGITSYELCLTSSFGSLFQNSALSLTTSSQVWHNCIIAGNCKAGKEIKANSRIGMSRCATLLLTLLPDCWASREPCQRWATSSSCAVYIEEDEVETSQHFLLDCHCARGNRNSTPKSIFIGLKAGQDRIEEFNLAQVRSLDQRSNLI